MIHFKDSKSAMFQESFVLSMTQEKRNGFYVELGSGDPYEESNTFLLESRYNWTGLAIDIDEKICDKYNLSSRTNKCINVNALNFDYTLFFKNNYFPKNIDFLQIDIDGHDEKRCLKALEVLPLADYRFSVIIIEHDLCLDYKRKSMRDAQRKILMNLGYKLIVETMSEDWWIDPISINPSTYETEYHIGNVVPTISK